MKKKETIYLILLLVAFAVTAGHLIAGINGRMPQSTLTIIGDGIALIILIILVYRLPIMKD